MITIFAARFEGGVWNDWEHVCTDEEIEAVTDSTNVKAQDQGRPGKPTHSDYLAGARYEFDVAFGTRESPKEGDLRVYGVRVDDFVIARYEDLLHHFALKFGA